jgi:hypothetical protein
MSGLTVGRHDARWRPRDPISTPRKSRRATTGRDPFLSDGRTYWGLPRRGSLATEGALNVGYDFMNLGCERVKSDIYIARSTSAIFGPHWARKLTTVFGYDDGQGKGTSFARRGSSFPDLFPPEQSFTETTTPQI